MRNSKYRIAVLSVHSSPLGQPGIGDTGGMSIYIREITQALAKQGHIVDIYTRNHTTAGIEILELAPNVNLIHIPAGEPTKIDKLLVYSYAPNFACQVENFRKQQDQNYDYIFSHYWISGITGLYLQAWWQIPHVVMYHTLGAAKNDIGIGEDEPEIRIHEEKMIAKDCHGVIAATKKEKCMLRDYYDVVPEKISVIPCGVNQNLFRYIDRVRAFQETGLDFEKVVLFVGRIERLKGIDNLFRAISYLHHIQPTLLIVGEDGNRQGEVNKLKTLASELGIEDRVKFVGLVDYQKLPYYYNAADVCVLPSYYESFGLVPLESLACGTPVVTTDVGELRDIILEGQTGFVLPDNQPQRLAEKIELILSGKASNLRKPDFIRNSISRYAWENVATSVVETLEKLAVRHPVHH